MAFDAYWQRARLIDEICKYGIKLNQIAEIIGLQVLAWGITQCG